MNQKPILFFRKRATYVSIDFKFRTVLFSTVNDGACWLDCQQDEYFRQEYALGNAFGIDYRSFRIKVVLAIANHSLNYWDSSLCPMVLKERKSQKNYNPIKHNRRDQSEYIELIFKLALVSFSNQMPKH